MKEKGSKSLLDIGCKNDKIEKPMSAFKKSAHRSTLKQKLSTSIALASNGNYEMSSSSTPWTMKSPAVNQFRLSGGNQGAPSHLVLSDSEKSVSTGNLDNSQIPELSSDDLTEDEDELEPLSGFGEFADPDGEPAVEKKKIQFECFLKTKSNSSKNFKAVIEG